MGESEAKVETSKTNGNPICRSPLPALTMKCKAGTLFHKPGHMLCTVAEGEELAGVGGVWAHTSRESQLRGGSVSCVGAAPVAMH